MLKIKNLHFSYPNEKPIFEDLNIEFPEKKISVILGRNGSGKTTLLKCIYGALNPKKGKIYIKDKEITSMSIKERAKEVSIVRQESHYIFPYSVIDVVLMGRTPHLNFLYKANKKDIEIAYNSLELVGIKNFHQNKINELSSGETQMVLLARALTQDASILLLDEPNAHLDITNQYKILKLVMSLISKRNLTVIAVIHNPEIAYWFGNQVFMFENGKILFQGIPEKVMTKKNLSRLYGMEMETSLFTKNYQAVIPKDTLIFKK